MPALAPAARFSQSRLKNAASPKRELSRHPFDRHAGLVDGLVDFSFSLLHSNENLGFVLKREIPEAEGLSAPTPMRASFAGYLSRSRAPARTAGRNRDTRRSSSSRVPCRSSENSRPAKRRRRLLQIGGKRLRLVTGLHLRHVVDVARIKKLGAVQGRARTACPTGTPS